MTGVIRLLASMSVALCIWLALPAVSFADPALARPTSQAARAHLTTGNRFFKASRWDDAIAEYRAGAALEAAPVFDYNLGQAHRMTGRFEASLAYYERFMATGKPTGELLAAVQAFCAEMRVHLANRALTMPPTGPAVVHQSATPPQAPATNVASVTASPPGSTTRRDDGEGVRIERRSESPPTRVIGWTATGLGVAAIGASGYMFLCAASFEGDANREPDTRRRNELHDGARTRRIAGTVTSISGAAMLTTGVVLLLTRDSRPTAGTLRAGLTGNGVAVFGRF